MKLKTMVAAAALAGFGALGLAGPAMAASNPATNDKADLYKNNAFCSGAQNKTPANDVGNAIFHRSQAGDTVSVNYHLQNAEPNATYTVQLYEGTCTFDTVLGTVTTDAQGNGNANFQDAAINPADTTFFTFAFTFTPFQEIESGLVTLP